MKPSGAFIDQSGEFRCRTCFRSCDTVTEKDIGGNAVEILYCDQGHFEEELTV